MPKRCKIGSGLHGIFWNSSGVVLDGTLSDNSSVMLVAKYSKGPVKLFAGYQFIRYAPPSNPYAAGAGFYDI